MELTVLLMPLLCSILVLELAAGYPSRAAGEVNKQDSYLDHVGARTRRETPGDTTGSEGEIIPSGSDAQEANPVDPSQQDTNTDPGYQDSNLDPPPGDSGTDPAPTENQGNLQETGSPGAVEGIVDPVYDMPADPHTDTHTEVLTGTASDPTSEPKQTKQPQPTYNPLIMSRHGEGAPLALPIHQDKPQATGEHTGEPTGEQPGEHVPAEGVEPSPADQQPHPDTAKSPPTPKPMDPRMGQMPYDPRYHQDPRYQQYQSPYQIQQGPVAMRQTGSAPPDSEPTKQTPEGSTPGRQVWGRNFRQPNMQQQQFMPMALPQRQGPPKGARQPPKQGGGKNQRASPNWSGGGANKPAPGAKAPPTGGGGGGQSPTQSPPGMPPHPMFDYRFYDPYYYMYGPGAQGNQGGQNPDGSGANPSAPPYPYPPYPPYPPYKMPEMPDGFMNPAYKMAYQQMGGQYPCMNMSDPMCMQMMQMGGEMDMEGPYGEMDMEGPYELDIEGPMAFQMLRNMGVARNSTDAHFPEITLNTHVLEAMQKRFGVNTTAGIQRMSSNPEFQAFMYQVLTHSAPVSLAEFNANLSKAAVNEIIRNLDSGTTNQRIPAGNLNHAHLNTQGASNKGASLTLDNHPASNLLPNFGGMSPFGPFPGQTGPFPGPFPGQMGPFPGQSGASPGQTAQLVQNPVMTEGAQMGSFQALVQQPMGAGGEAPEKPEVKKKVPATTVKPTISNTTDSHGHPIAAGLVAIHGTTQKNITGNQPATTAGNKPIQPTFQSPTIQSHSGAVQTDQSKAIAATVGSPAVQNPPAQQPVQTKEKDIVGKDSKQGLSKDQRTRQENIANTQNTVNTPQTANTQNAVYPQNPANPQNAVNPQNPANPQNVVNPQNPANPLNPAGTVGNNAQPGMIDSAVKTGQSPTGTMTPGYPGNRENMPIGLKEAGILPTNNSVPIKAQSGYTSTGFAIAAGTIIALVVIFGPIGCMLWKMKEKRDERLRKKKAFKNRDMSENSIMESMVLNDFGKGSLNSVTNEGAKPYDYYHYGKDRYSMINADIGEMEKLSRNPEMPQGRLP